MLEGSTATKCSSLFNKQRSTLFDLSSKGGPATVVQIRAYTPKLHYNSRLKSTSSRCSIHVWIKLHSHHRASPRLPPPSQDTVTLDCFIGAMECDYGKIFLEKICVLIVARDQPYTQILTAIVQLGSKCSRLYYHDFTIL